VPTTTQTDPVALLKQDHKAVQELFDKFEKGRTEATRKKAARQAIEELKVHAAIEEEIFYPAFDAEVGGGESHDIYLEAEEEHHVVHVLIGELDAMADDDEHFDAKFTVLAENVRHHIEEEETQMLPKAKALGKERLQDLGSQMAARKGEMTGMKRAS